MKVPERAAILVVAGLLVAIAELGRRYQASCTGWVGEFSNQGECGGDGERAPRGQHHREGRTRFDRVHARSYRARSSRYARELPSACAARVALRGTQFRRGQIQCSDGC